MNNQLVFQPGASLIGDVLWQSGLFLGIGLVLSLALTRRPARAHRVLVLAMAGALVTPLFSQIVQRVGWGFLSTSVPHSPPVVATSTAAISSFDSLSGTVQLTLTEPVPTRTSRDGAEHLSAVDQPITTISTRVALMGLWCVLSGLCLARLAVSLVLGHRIVGRARLIVCEATGRAVDAACTRLKLGVRPVLRASSRVALSGDLVLGPPAGDRLAGCRRHVGGSGRLGRCVLPRAGALGCGGTTGRACLARCWSVPCPGIRWPGWPSIGWDSSVSWRATTGCSRPVCRPRIMPSRCWAWFRSGGRAWRWRRCRAVAGLFGRVKHILDERRSSPVVGRRWACLSAAAMVLAASAVALAQSRPADRRTKSKPSGDTANRIKCRPRKPKGNRDETHDPRHGARSRRQAGLGSHRFLDRQPQGPSFPSWRCPRIRTPAMRCRGGRWPRRRPTPTASSHLTCRLRSRPLPSLQWLGCGPAGEGPWGWDALAPSQVGRQPTSRYGCPPRSLIRGRLLTPGRHARRRVFGSRSTVSITIRYAEGCTSG